MTALQQQIHAWRTGIASELQFWDHWMQTRGDRWPEDFNGRLAGADSDQLRHMVGLGGPGARILDVGAGPLSILGNRVGDRRVDVTACDPLAAAYNALLAKHGIAAPVPVVMATAEDLSAFFEPESFDIVHCRNALDHSYDPLRGVQEMARVAKVGGIVALQHNGDEAERENYTGFHQWNITIRDGRFCIWNRSSVSFVDEHVPECAIEAQGNADWNFFVLRKHRPSAPDANRQRARIAEMTDSLLRLAMEGQG